MTLSEQLQSFIYELDDLLDSDAEGLTGLEDLSESLNQALVNADKMEIKKATAEYLEAKRCLDEACACVKEATDDLGKSQHFIQTLTKVVEAIGRIV